MAVVVVVIWWVGRQMGKEAADKAARKPLPNSGSGIPQERQADGTMASWSPTAIANELYSVMNSTWATGWDKQQAYSKAMALTPDQLTALYNDFNRRHGRGETLTQWIDDEWFPTNKLGLPERLRGLGLD